MTEEQRRQLTIHEQYPNIPLGVDLRAITRADRSPARGILDETITVERLLRQDRLKGGPMELFRIELAVADWAHECAARGDGTVAELLVPEPGWTLPTQTRRSFQKLARFELRTVVYSVDSDRREDYYDTDRGRNPALPGEVADYVGVGTGESLEMPLGTSGDHVVLTRDAQGEVHLNGLGDYIAERGYSGGEVWLAFTSSGEFIWDSVGPWLPMET